MMRVTNLIKLICMKWKISIRVQHIVYDSYKISESHLTEKKYEIWNFDSFEYKLKSIDSIFSTDRSLRLINGPSCETGSD